MVSNGSFVWNIGHVEQEREKKPRSKAGGEGKQLDPKIIFFDY